MEKFYHIFNDIQRVIDHEEYMEAVREEALMYVEALYPQLRGIFMEAV